MVFELQGCFTTQEKVSEKHKLKGFHPRSSYGAGATIFVGAARKDNHSPTFHSEGVLPVMVRV